MEVFNSEPRKETGNLVVEHSGNPIKRIRNGSKRRRNPKSGTEQGASSKSENPVLLNSPHAVSGDGHHLCF